MWVLFFCPMNLDGGIAVQKCSDLQAKKQNRRVRFALSLFCHREERERHGDLFKYQINHPAAIRGELTLAPPKRDKFFMAQKLI
jgi:hypothetical protein